MNAVIICVGGGKDGIISLHSQEELDAFLARPEVKSAQLIDLLQAQRGGLRVHVEERLFEEEDEPKRKKPRNKPKRSPPPPRHNKLPKKGRNRGFR